jgi:hypothetical protein
MNIFTVLSQGKGRLDEENLSAFFGFLLNPVQTHGLGDTFLKHFLKLLARECNEPNRFAELITKCETLRADAELESVYYYEGARRSIDITVRLYTRTLDHNDEPVDIEEHRIAIENKVRPDSATDNQLKEEYLGILEDIESDNPTKVTMVFVTPPGYHPKLASEFDRLSGHLREKDRKVWLRWSDIDTSRRDLASLIRQILLDEQEARIEPFTDYLRHTLKAFVRHIVDGPAGSFAEIRETRAKVKPGGVVESASVKLSDGAYRIERYENKTVKVMNLDTGQYEAAKPILRRIAEEISLGIDLCLGTGREKNARNLGKQMIHELINQGKDTQAKLLDQTT